MNTKTLAAITKHGQSLLRAFPSAIEQDPVALCKKLRRIEVAVSKPVLDYCNGDNGVTVEQLDVATERATARTAALLGMSSAQIKETGLHVNRDPRGYALKLESDWTREYNNGLYAAGLHEFALYSDFGSYGILAPDLNQ